MKVLHIIDSGGLYGAEIMLLNLVAEQQKLGLHPIIASIGDILDGEKPLEIEAKRRDLPLQVFRFRSGLNFKGALQILKFAGEKQFQILHSHGYKGNILFGFMPRFVRKLPIVATIHGWTNTGRFDRMRVYEWLDRQSLKFVDQAVLVNKKMLADPRVAGFINHCQVVDNGIPAEKDSADDKPDLDILQFCKKARTLCAIGRLSPEKGFDNLLRAFAKIREVESDIQLLIIGEGRQREYLERLVDEFALSGSVMLAGYRTEASQYLSSCSALVISSLTEGLPITLLEAMREKVPVVATSVGGIPDVLSDVESSILVGPQSVESLADGISFVLKSDSRNQVMIERAREIFLAKYTSHAMAVKYEKIYKAQGRHFSFRRVMS